MVAAQERRNGIGIELKKEYIELCKKRLEPHTNQTNLTGEKTTLEVITNQEVLPR